MDGALGHSLDYTEYKLKLYMKTSTKVAAGGVAAALIVGVAALNPRAKIDSGHLYAVSCTTKHFYLPAVSYTHLRAHET